MQSPLPLPLLLLLDSGHLPDRRQEMEKFRGTSVSAPDCSDAADSCSLLRIALLNKVGETRPGCFFFFTDEISKKAPGYGNEDQDSLPEIFLP